ncbi:MAG TPA: alpha/beta fold hydrolase [Thermoanaerobaculia bacterium]|nr:alpha/beta fold hydrolase [Thermoanaerobaculia bacterium]
MIDALARQMTYPAPSVRVPSPPPSPLREVAIASEAGEVSAWWLPPSAPDGPVVLMLHGNGENLETMRLSGLLEDLAGLGAGVLAIDYPGYGRSAGVPSERSLVAAAESAWRWLCDAAPSSPRLVVGWSLGAAVAVQVAARHVDTVDAAILLSPWDTLHGVASRFFPSFVVGLLSDRYDSVAAAALVRCPTLVVHGERDDIIPVELGERLFQALPEPKRWVAIPTVGHNDLLAHPGPWREIGDFLAAVRP